MGLLFAFLTVATMRGSLVLSGNTAGFFQPVSTPYATVANSPSGLDSSWLTGVPGEGSFRSGVKFNGQGFHDLENGETFSFGLITYYNGRSRIGTSSGSSLLDLYLNFDDPALGQVHLATITFGIDATVDRGGNLKPDLFTAKFVQPGPIWLNGEWVNFSIGSLPASSLVAENGVINLGDITVTVLIPESATFGSILGVAILTFALFRGRSRAGMPA